MISWMFLGFYRTVMHKKSSTSHVEKHKHTKVVWNQWWTPCLQQTYVLHIAMKHKSALTIQYTMHKRTSTNKDNEFGGRSTPSIGKNFKTNINADSKQHEQSFVVFMHVEKTSHPPQWRLALLASTNKALATMHTVKERLGENKKPMRAPFDEFCNSCVKQVSEEEDDFLTTRLLGWLRSLVGEINNCCCYYLPTP